jgi:hypothetical protein
MFARVLSDALAGSVRFATANLTRRPAVRVLGVIGACIGSAAILAACDGGTSSPGSKSNFIAQADQACTAFAKAESAFPQATSEIPTEVRFLTGVIPLRQNEINRLRTLSAPSNVATDYKTFLSNAAKDLQLDQQALQAAQQGDRAQLTKLGQKSGSMRASDKQLAEKIGFGACAARLPPNEQKDVMTVIRRTITTSAPQLCTQDLTPRYITMQFGSLQKCLAAQRSTANNAKSVDVSNIAGVSHVYANAVELDHGGLDNGKKLRRTLLYQGGNWKIDQVVLAGS